MDTARKVLIVCDKCNERGKIRIPDILPYVNGNPIISILVRKEICEHDILLFVDRSYTIRGQTKIDYTIGDKLPKLSKPKKESKFVKKMKFWWLYHFTTTFEIATWKLKNKLKKFASRVSIAVYRFGMHTPDEQNTVIRRLRDLAVKMSDKMDKSVKNARMDIAREIREALPSLYSIESLAKYERDEYKPIISVAGVMQPTQEIIDEMIAHREEMKNILRMYRVALCNSG